MPPTNGNRVTLAQVYGVLGEYRREVNACLTEIRLQNGQQGEAIARICATEEEREKRVDNLDKRDRLGTVISGVAIAIGTALGIIIAPKQ